MNKNNIGKICFICKGNKTVLLTKNHRGGNIYKCLHCRNAYTSPPPDFNYSSTDKFLFKQSDYDEAVSYSRPQLDFIMNYRRSGKLLDIGSGIGSLVDLSGKHGFLSEGLEPSKLAVNDCLKRGLKIKKGYLKRNSYKNDSFDIVAASHVLEHVKKPDEFLKIISLILKKSGYLFLAQTNYEGTFAKLYKKYWEGWVTDQHYVHFSPEGIKFYLERNNFKVVEITLVSSGYRLLWRWGGIGTILNNLYFSAGFLLTKILQNFSFKGDQMYILARKK